MRNHSSQDWKKIQVTDFIKQLPRFLSPIVYEINKLGEVRRYNPIARTPVYAPVETTERAGIKYLSFVVGWAHSVVMRTTLPIDKILQKYFN